MIKPFHLSFVVPDLDQARDFYINFLGCDLGRDKGVWIDIIFFGHQLTLHQQREGKTVVAIDHFGAIVEPEEWSNLVNNCKLFGVEFELSPTVFDAGLDNESGKFIVKDPAGNVLEFKYYRNFGKTVANQKS